MKLLFSSSIIFTMLMASRPAYSSAIDELIHDSKLKPVTIVVGSDGEIVHADDPRRAEQEKETIRSYQSIWNDPNSRAKAEPESSLNSLRAYVKELHHQHHRAEMDKAAELALVEGRINALPEGWMSKDKHLEQELMIRTSARMRALELQKFVAEKEIKLEPEDQALLMRVLGDELAP